MKFLLSLVFAILFATQTLTAAPFAYVANLVDNTVSVIDISTNLVVATVPVGNSPQAIAVTPNGQFAYVTNNGTNTVSVIDASTNMVVATITVESSPTGIAITPNGQFAYVASFSLNRVSVIDISTNTVIGPPISVGGAPEGIAITPNGQFVYVTNSADNTVSVIDTSSNTVVDTIPVEAAPSSISITPNGLFAYVGNSGTTTVSVIDLNTNFVTTNIDVGGFPESGGNAVSPNGQYAYIAVFSSPSTQFISVINTTSQTVTTTIPLPSISDPEGIAITPDGKYAYVTYSDQNEVGIIDLSTNMVTGSPITVGTVPFGIAIAPPYSPPPPPPPPLFQPFSFSGKIVNRNGTFTLKAEWPASPSSNIIAYEIFAFDQLIAIVPSGSPLVFERTLHPHNTHSHHWLEKYQNYLNTKYRVRAVNSNNSRSGFTNLNVQDF